MQKYDIVVLGAGPGGYVAAIRAAQLGKAVAIVEQAAAGGVCLNVGCIPTKTLVRNAEILHLAGIGAKRGIRIETDGVDIEKAIAAKDAVVRQLTGGVEMLLKGNGVEIYKGKGIATMQKTILVEGEKPVEIGYDKLIIATGSRPATLPIPGADGDYVADSTDLLSTKKIPAHLIIIGGGVVGCEFASIFRSFGSQVTVIEMLPRLLANMDSEVSAALQTSFRRQKIDVKLETAVTGMEKTDGGVRVLVKKGEEESTIEGDLVLVSVGRKANTAGLEALDLATDRGFVKTDDDFATSAPDVYAIGDVTGRFMLAHAASAMGVQVVETICEGGVPAGLGAVPGCVFTAPEIGAVGLTEAQARDAYGEILVGRFPLAASGKALAMGETEGMYKLIAETKTEKIVGAHLVGAGATELVSTVAAYMAMGATLKDVTKTIFAHPTLAECIMEAAHDAEGCCVHLPPRSKKQGTRKGLFCQTDFV